MNAPNDTTPPTPANTTSLPPCAHSISAYVTPLKPAVASTAPIQSSLRESASSLLSGTFHKAISTVATASGTFRKKTHRHDPCCTSHPYCTVPIDIVIAVNPNHVQIAAPLLSSENDALIRARLPGTSKAPPTPCRLRARISCRISPAAPHHTEASANTTTPAVKTLRLPYRSPSEPPTSSSAERNSAYASTTHCTSAPLACSPVCRAGRATLTTVLSINAMLDPSTVATSTQTPPSGADADTRFEKISASSHGVRTQFISHPQRNGTFTLHQSRTGLDAKKKCQPPPRAAGIVVYRRLEKH